MHFYIPLYLKVVLPGTTNQTTLLMLILCLYLSHPLAVIYVPCKQSIVFYDFGYATVHCLCINFREKKEVCKKAGNKWYSILKVLFLFRHFITLTAGLHPSTSEVCMGPLPTRTYQLPRESAEVCTEGVHQKLEFWIWVYASVMQPAPLTAEDTTWNSAYSIKWSMDI